MEDKYFWHKFAFKIIGIIIIGVLSLYYIFGYYSCQTTGRMLKIETNYYFLTGCWMKINSKDVNGNPLSVDLPMSRWVFLLGKQNYDNIKSKRFFK